MKKDNLDITNRAPADAGAETVAAAAVRSLSEIAPADSLQISLFAAAGLINPDITIAEALEYFKAKRFNSKKLLKVLSNIDRVGASAFADIDADYYISLMNHILDMLKADYYMFVRTGEYVAL